MSENESHSSGADASRDLVVRCKAGEHVFEEGDPGDVMYIVREGEVEILSDEGRRHEAILETGDFFGEGAILENLPRVTTARARTDCELLRIDSKTFTRLASRNPEIPIRMLRKLLRRIREISGSARDADLSIALPAARAAETARPAPAPPSAGRPRFVHEPSGTEFPLADDEQTYIGRFDPITGFRPQIELKDVDPDRSTSRRHARIIRRGDAFFLLEEVAVANGTFVNDARLSGDAEVELHDGDRIRFGLVETVFRTS